MERPRDSSLEQNRVDTGVNDSSEISESSVERRSKIPYLLELLGYPRVVEGGLIRGDVDGGGGFDVFGESGDGGVGGFSGEDSRLHRSVGTYDDRQSDETINESEKRTFDFRNVEESSGTPNQSSPGEGELRDRLETTLVERSRSVRNAFSTLENVGEERMMFQSLRRIVSVAPTTARKERTCSSLNGERYGLG